MNSTSNRTLATRILTWCYLGIWIVLVICMIPLIAIHALVFDSDDPDVTRGEHLTKGKQRCT